MKKLLSLFLAVLMVFALSVPMIFSAVGPCEYITVYLEGYGRALYIDDETGSRQVYPTLSSGIDDEDMEYLKAKIAECAELLPAAIATGNYEEYSQKVCEAVEPFYADIRLDDNGDNIEGGAYADSTYEEFQAENYKNQVRNKNQFTSSDGVCRGFEFAYDWRLSPLVLTDRLDSYINMLVAVYGNENTKINLVGRCLSSSIVSSYIANLDGKYNTDRIAAVAYYMPTVKGCYVVSNAFAGRFDIDAAALEDFVNNSSLISGLDADILAVIQGSVGFLNTLNGLEYPGLAVSDIIKMIYKEIAPDVVMATYGTFPSFWSMVSAEDYPAARANVFTGQEEKYAGLLEKLDRYYENVQLKIDDILKEKALEGMQVYIFAKYNISPLPLFEESSEVGDFFALTSAQSFGATTAPIGTVLDDSYISSLENDKYISSDHMIDASTCLFPDNTWFLKNLHHNYTPSCVDAMMSKILLTGVRSGTAVTVDTFEEYPQYVDVDADNDTMKPMIDEPEEIPTEKENFFQKLIKFIKGIFALFTKLFSK